MSQYSFVTVWRLRAPQKQVWDAIYNSEDWPNWWPAVQRVQKINPGDENGVDGVHRYHWRTRLPYTFSFTIRTTRVEPPNHLEGEADGELQGTGVWHLSQADGVTSVRYDWNVTTAKSWMNFIAPLARPLFQWNHDAIMRDGGRALARHLRTELL